MPSEFPPDHYYSASMERLTDAARLHQAERYVASVYLSGVAVECMLRAYRSRTDPTFDSRHDLTSLMTSSGIMDFIKDHERRDFACHLGTVWRFWRNSWRYAEHSRFDSHVASLEPSRKSPFAKWASSEVYDSATYVVSRGKYRWSSKIS